MGTSGGAVIHKSWAKLALYGYCHPSHSSQKQAGAELGQAQLKLGLRFTVIFCRLGFSSRMALCSYAQLLCLFCFFKLQIAYASVR